MAAQKGRDLLLKIGTGTPETFQTVAGLRTRSLTLNSGTVDVTHAESAGQWRELLAGAAVRSATVSAAGIFSDQTSDDLVRAAFFAGETRNYQLIVPDFGTLSGPFQITALEYAGTYDGEVTFSITLASAGVLAFVAA
ncbi:MAG: phage major tail protein, TP901-1 family [Alphaproteobacteria bacterium]|nr:phage major tail protein, TP901-1 family [Alphaproteobacteria bacterium]